MAIPQTESVSAMRWVCPLCPEREVYEPVTDGDLQEYARAAYAQCVRDFDETDDAAWATRLLIGLRPECVREADVHRYDLYLARGSDPHQLRLQIGHEMFHRVVSRGAIFHWTHEMLACVMSVRLMRQFGANDYADRMRAQYRRDADALPVSALLTADLRLPPPTPTVAAGIYGRAYALGEALIDAVGWPALCRVARWGLDSGMKSRGRTTPNVAGWRQSLDADAAAHCDRILGTITEASPGEPSFSPARLRFANRPLP